MAKREDIDPKEVEDGAAADLSNEPSESKAKDQAKKRTSASSSDDNDGTGSDQLVTEEPADDPGPPPPESINLEQFQQRTDKDNAHIQFYRQAAIKSDRYQA